MFQAWGWEESNRSSIRITWHQLPIRINVWIFVDPTRKRSEESNTCLRLSIILLDTRRPFPFRGKMHRRWFEPWLRRTSGGWIALEPSLLIEEPTTCPSYFRRCANSCRSRALIRQALILRCKEKSINSIWNSTRVWATMSSTGMIGTNLSTTL